VGGPTKKNVGSTFFLGLDKPREHAEKADRDRGCFTQKRKIQSRLCDKSITKKLSGKPRGRNSGAKGKDREVFFLTTGHYERDLKVRLKGDGRRKMPRVGSAYKGK